MNPQDQNCAVMFDPHPDDADFWTGGLTLLLRKANWQVHYVCCGVTSPETRMQAEESARVLDVQRHFLEIPLTGNSRLRDNLCEKVVPLLQQLRPRMAFIPALNDYHPEHCELSRELLPLFRASGRFQFPMPELYAYDSHEGRDPVEIYIDIASVFDRHMESLRCHRWFAKPDYYSSSDNTLTRIKTGRSMVLGASLPHPKARTLHAEGYRMIWGHPKEVSTLQLLLPDQFYFRPSAWMTSMWQT